MKVVIVDDDLFYGKILEALCQKINLQVKATFQSPIKAIKYLESNTDVDLIFLDIHMPGLTGFELLSTLNNPPKVIITTSDPTAAVQAFDFDADDFMVKPITLVRFTKAVNKIKNIKEGTNTGIYINSNKRLIKVEVDSIYVIEAKGDYLLFKLADNSNHIVYGTMKKMIARLPSDKFLRVHRSFIVNMKAANGIVENNIRIGSHVVPISRSNRRKVLSQLNYL